MREHLLQQSIEERRNEALRLQLSWSRMLCPGDLWWSKAKVSYAVELFYRSKKKTLGKRAQFLLVCSSDFHLVNI